MSKRSQVSGASRGRFGIPPLRDIRIRPKLGIILVVPVLALVGLSIVRLLDTGQRAVAAEDVRTYARFSSTVSELVQDLQVERTAAYDLLDKDDRGDGPDDDDAAAFDRAVAETDAALSAYAGERDGLENLPDLFDQAIRDADNLLESIATHRDDTHQHKIADTSAVGRYTNIINKLIAVHEVIAQVTEDPELSIDIRVASLLSRVKEATDREKLAVLTTEKDHEFNTEEYLEFMTFLTSRELAKSEMTSVSTVERRNEIAQMLFSTESRAATQVEQQLSGVVPGDRLDVDYATWLAAMDERRDAARSVEIELENAIVEKATELRDDVVTRVLIESAIVLLTLTLAVALALVIARSMASSLRHLREGALQMAHVDLPEAVARLRDSEVLGQSTPDEFAERLAEPLRLRNKDEIGQVAQAFNIVHKEAVRVAAEQAALRSSVSTMFVNLARRSQILVDRLIGHLDRLERGEEDPDRLGELFQLDHLATRMRRNDENLLVLAGADSARVQREPATVGDLLRAAQSEVEQYTRLEFGTILAEREITAAAVNDLVHLVAELFDNATAFSSPESSVVAEARQSGDHIVILITDRGIGISDAQLADLNEQLARPPLVDLAASRMMGLVVVGRLAARHGVRVTLRPGELGGIVAEVVIPDAILTDGHGAPARRQHDASPQTGAASRDTSSVPGGSFNGFAAATTGTQDAVAGDERDEHRRGLFEPARGAGDDDLPPEPEYGSAPHGDRDEPAETDREGDDVPAMTFRPGGGQGDAERRGRKVMELTGEIVHETEGVTDPDAPVHAPVEGPTEAFPMITLEATTTGRRTIAGGANGTAESDEESGGESRWAALNDIPTWPPPRSTEKPTPPPSGAADETMEIPIFREVSSAWFTATPAVARSGDEHTPRPSGGEDPASGPGAGPVRSNGSAGPEGSFLGAAPESPEVPEPPTLPPRQRDGDRDRNSESTSTRQEESMSSEALPSPSDHADFWSTTSADDGWRAAQAAASGGDEPTNSGLPKRTPMAQLVPGSIEVPDDQPMRANQRDPEGVRGLLSAYHRGVQRGRVGRTVDDDTARSQAGRFTNGKEHDA